MATGTPGTNGVWQYGEDDSEATFSALLNKAASTTDTQIGLDRGRLTTLEARKLSAASPVIPTGVTVSTGSGSYNSTTGLVTFTNARDIDMTGIFTAAYKNYSLLINMTASGTSDIFSWFTTSGTNITTFWYGGSFYVNLTGATGTANLRNNGNGGFCGYIASSGNPTNSQLEIYIDSALPKAQYDFMTYSRGAASTIFGGYGTDGNPTGFRISPATGGITLTGTMKVIGWN